MHSACRVTKSDGISTVSTMRKLLFSLSLFQQIVEITCSRRFDIANERLPEFDPSASPGIFPAPSMRRSETENMELLIKRTLEDDDEDEGDGVVDRIADRIAMERLPQGRPRALKRFETT